MHTRKIFLITMMVIITSLACSLGFLSDIINRLPLLGVRDNDPDSSLPTIVPTLGAELNTPNPRQSTPEILPQTAGDLAYPNSYQSLFTVAITGIDQNTTIVDESLLYFQEKIINQNAVHIETTTEIDGNVEAFGQVYQLEGRSYFLERKPDQVGLMCSLIGEDGMTDLPEIPPYLSADQLFQEVERGELVESNVTIHGINADHYNVTSMLVNGEPIYVDDGHIWLASPGGYVVRFLGNAEGEFSSLVTGNLVTGKLKWTYEMERVNQLREILLPSECVDISKNRGIDLPLPENAFDVNTMGTLTTFYSTDDTQVVSAFFKEKLPELGFTQKDISEFESTAILVFQKNSQTYSIVISPEPGGGTMVLITIE